MFKIFFQQLCEVKVGWDDLLMGRLRQEWDQLCSALKRPEPLTTPQSYVCDLPESPLVARLIGFCDASTKVYAAVIYLRLEGKTNVIGKFLAAKTRVAPLGSMTVPQLELSSALLSRCLTNYGNDGGQSFSLSSEAQQGCSYPCQGGSNCHCV